MHETVLRNIDDDGSGRSTAHFLKFRALQPDFAADPTYCTSLVRSTDGLVSAFFHIGEAVRDDRTRPSLTVLALTRRNAGHWGGASLSEHDVASQCL